MTAQRVPQANRRSNTLLAFHRRFLLRQKLGRAWRAHIHKVAGESGRFVTASAISHIISADWTSRSLEIERIIAEILGLPFSDVWPEYTLKVSHRVATEGQHDGQGQA